MSRRSVRVIPSASRLIGSLRDLGYEPTEAVADLIDNSIAAGARNVDVTVHWDGGDSWLRITDDGRGMDGSRITEAMRYGAARDYDDDDLGKFGLGLKTASMSQCRRLTVASRTPSSKGKITARQLDLDYIEQQDDWDVLIPRASERPEQLTQHLGPKGTVVLWEKLDRILTYKDPSSGWARNHLLDLAERLERHLGMVFHRFLQGESRRAKLRIRVNGTAIEPWDPFARGESATIPLDATSYPLNTPHGSGLVEVVPYILPPRDQFSSVSEHRRLAGPNGWNRQQGLYIYRADRLIQSGGWSRLRKPDEHTKLARLAVSFKPTLDAAFGINVAKMRVTLPPELRDQIEDDVSQVVNRARRVYDAKPEDGGGNRRRARTKATPAAERGATPTSPDDGRPSSTGRPGTGTLSPSPAPGENDGLALRRREALQRAARFTGEEQALERIVEALNRSDQEVARDLGW